MSRTLSSESILRLALVSCALPMFVSSALPISFPTPSCGSLVPPSGSSVFLWAAAPPAASPGPLVALSSRRAPCARAKHATRTDQPIVATHGPVGAGRAHREHPADTQGGPRAPLTPPAHRRSSPRAPPPRDQPREPPPSAFITSCGSSLIASSCPTVTTQLPHSYYTVTTQLPHSYYMRNLGRKRDSCQTCNKMNRNLKISNILTRRCVLARFSRVVTVW